jgi:hypothetical protein
MVQSTTLNLLHQWLSHVGEEWLHQMAKLQGLMLLCGNTLTQCIVCIKGKQTCPMIGKGLVTWADTPMHTIHYDVCRLMPVVSHAQHLYFISFIDDHTCYT